MWSKSGGMVKGVRWNDETARNAGGHFLMYRFRTGQLGWTWTLLSLFWVSVWLNSISPWMDPIFTLHTLNLFPQTYFRCPKKFIGIGIHFTVTTFLPLTMLARVRVKKQKDAPPLFTMGLINMVRPLCLLCHFSRGVLKVGVLFGIPAMVLDWRWHFQNSVGTHQMFPVIL